jgi:hypothetical protein
LQPTDRSERQCLGLFAIDVAQPAGYRRESLLGPGTIPYHAPDHAGGN